MFKTLFKRKEKSEVQEKQEERQDFPSLDERPLFRNTEPQTLTFKVAGMDGQNERGEDIQAALIQHLQTYIQENSATLKSDKLEDLALKSAQVIFFPDASNTDDPHATKVYLDFTFTQLHIGYVPAEATALLIDIINGKKAREFTGTFRKEFNNENNYHFHISIKYL